MGDVYTFKLGEAFNPNDAFDLFFIQMSAQVNDITTCYRHHVDAIRKSKTPLSNEEKLHADGDDIYFMRMMIAHVKEVVDSIDRISKFNEFQKILSRMEEPGKKSLQKLLSLANEKETNEQLKEMENIRNRISFHYGSEKYLSDAIKKYDPENTEVSIAGSIRGDFRAGYADPIMKTALMDRIEYGGGEKLIDKLNEVMDLFLEAFPELWRVKYVEKL